MLVLVSAGYLLSPKFSQAQDQYFSDETARMLPETQDMCVDADFGDIDGDGYLDIFLSETAGSDFPNMLWVNIVGDSFVDETAARLPESGANRNSRDGDFGDVDRDGDLDIFISNSDQLNQLRMNDGNGFFTDGGPRIPGGYWIRYSKDGDFGDIDGDIDLDILVGNFNYQAVLLYINDGEGYFEIAPPSRFPSGPNYTNQVDFADVDGDLDLDAALANNTGYEKQLMINDGTGWFSDESSQRIPVDTNQSNDIEFGDVDSDGDLDIGIANGFFARCKLWINDGQGYFIDETNQRLPFDSGASSEIDFGDVDNDNDLDIIIANSSQGGLSNRLYINDGEGYFTDETSARFPSAEEESSDMDFGDVDNDGDLDIIIANLGMDGVGEQNRLLVNISTPDSFPPTIPRTYQHPDTGDTINPYFTTTTAWDNISVVIGELKTSLFYRALDDTTNGLSEIDFLEIPMLDCGGFLYRERIPAQSSGKRVEYYIRSEDRMGNVSFDPPNAPDSVFSFLVDAALGIGNSPPSASLPKAFSISQNYPNPFNPSTTIDYEIPEGESVPARLRIFDIRGHLIRTLEDTEKTAGRYSVHWDGKNNKGEQVGSGVYLYRIEAGDFASTRKMILAR